MRDEPVAEEGVVDGHRRRLRPRRGSTRGCEVHLLEADAYRSANGVLDGQSF